MAIRLPVKCLFLLIIVVVSQANAAVFNRTYSQLEKATLEATRRQQVYAKNIANLSNPDYVPVDEKGKPISSKLEKDALLENEMSKMSQNNVKYTAYVKMMSLRFQTLRKIVTLGK